MRFIGRWLSQTIGLGLALLFAILAMQAPSFTHEYQAALQQVAQDSRHDIEQRKESARKFYGITAEGDDQFVTALKPFEPSNAETLALSVGRAVALQSASDRFAASAPLLQPLVALRDAFDDEHGYKAVIWRTLLGQYGVQLSFSFAAVCYGLIGLLLGSFAAQLVLAAGAGLAGMLGLRRRHRYPT